MGIEMNQRERAAARFRECAQQRQRDRVVAAERDEMLVMPRPAPRSARGCSRCRRARCRNRRYRQPAARRDRSTNADDRRRPACGSPGGSPPARSGRRCGWWCRCRTGCRRCERASAARSRDREEARRQREGRSGRHHGAAAKRNTAAATAQVQRPASSPIGCRRDRQCCRK